MRKILNHPIEVAQNDKYKWDDSGKYVALQELFEQLGFGEDDALVQNKVFYISQLRLSYSHDLQRQSITLKKFS